MPNRVGRRGESPRDEVRHSLTSHSRVGWRRGASSATAREPFRRESTDAGQHTRSRPVLAAATPSVPTMPGLRGAAWRGASTGLGRRRVMGASPPPSSRQCAEDRVAKLRTFWDEATQTTGPQPDRDASRARSTTGCMPSWRLPGVARASSVTGCLACGRPAMGAERRRPVRQRPPSSDPVASRRLRAVEPGRHPPDGWMSGCGDREEVYFDTAREVVRPSTSSPAPPSSRLSARGGGWARSVRRGYTNNLPLDPLFETEPGGTSCASPRTCSRCGRRARLPRRGPGTRQRPHLRQRAAPGDCGAEARV